MIDPRWVRKVSMKGRDFLVQDMRVQGGWVQLPYRWGSNLERDVWAQTEWIRCLQGEAASCGVSEAKQCKKSIHVGREQPGTEGSDTEQGSIWKASLQRVAWHGGVKTHVELGGHLHSGGGMGQAVCNIRELAGWSGYPHKKIAWSIFVMVSKFHYYSVIISQGY